MVLPHFDDYLEKYANLLIKKGVNIQKGQTLLITIAVEHHKLARLLTKKAYEAGAAEVLLTIMMIRSHARSFLRLMKTVSCRYQIMSLNSHIISLIKKQAA